MTLFLLGLAVFFAAHLVTLIKPAKAVFVGAMGAQPYWILHVVVSIAGMTLLVMGYLQAPFQPLYDPMTSRAAPHALMPFAFILVAGANMRSNLKRYVRHPMSLGVLLWAGSHLAVNGDLASVLLFGAFGAYALLDFVISKPAPAPPVQPRSKDLILIVAGLVAYAVMMWAHGAVFGVYVVG